MQTRRAAAEVAAPRQPAENRAVRRQLLVGPRGDQGAGALVRHLAGQSQAGAHGGRRRHRLHAADRPLEGLRRRDRLSGRHAGNRDLGLRAAAGNQAHHGVRYGARAAVPSDHRGQADGDRRPHRRRPLRAEHRGRLERGRVRDVRRRAARARDALRICAGVDRRDQADVVGPRGVRFRRQVHQAEEGAGEAETLRRHAAGDHERRRVGGRPRPSRCATATPSSCRRRATRSRRPRSASPA